MLDIKNANISDIKYSFFLQQCSLQELIITYYAICKTKVPETLIFNT